MEQPPDGHGGQDQPAVSDAPPRCYRHPDRETGIRCTRCDRPICPECMVSASVGFQCPNCVREGSGTGHPAAATRPRTLVGGSVTADPRLVTKLLVAINLVVFILIQVVGTRLADDLGLVGYAADGRGGLIGVADGQYYRLFTSVFTHEAFLHIGFNMLSLWMIGGPLEAALGRARYLTLYLVSGLAGSALTYLLASQYQLTVGASGAIFGLFGATVVLVRKLNYDMRPVIALLVINLIITFGWAGIAWQAHIGGLVAGTVIGVAMVYAPRARRALLQYGASGLMLLVTVAIVVYRTAALT